MNNFGDPLEQYADRSLKEIESEYKRITSAHKEPKTWEEMLDLVKNLREHVDDIIEILTRRTFDEYLNTNAKMEDNE